MPDGGTLLIGTSAARRPGRDRSDRHRLRHQAGAPRTDLRAVLHDQAGGQRHRLGAQRQLRHRSTTRWDTGGRERAGQGNHVHHYSAFGASHGSLIPEPASRYSLGGMCRTRTRSSVGDEGIMTLKILVIAGDRSSGLSYQRMLCPAGYDVHCSADPRDGHSGGGGGRFRRGAGVRVLDGDRRPGCAPPDQGRQPVGSRGGHRPRRRRRTPWRQ